MSDTIDFGIDLGTTNSAIARFVSGKVELFKDPATWKDTLSSVVGFRKGRIITGNTARTYQEKDPLNVVSQFKRKMGTSEIFRIESLNATVSATELSAHILRALKTHVPSEETVDAAVITVPASFDIIQSNATIEAGNLAGIPQVLLLQEPIAASLAYANLSKDYLDKGTWLVYDLGGGTFDVALVSINDGDLRVVDHEGDNFLGGSDFDRLIVEHFAIPRICEKFEPVEMAADFQSASGSYNAEFYAILKGAEEAKIALSHAENTEFVFEFQDDEVVIDLSRKQFEEIIEAEVERTIHLVEKMLKRNQEIAKEVSFVLMVGGSTFIPFVRNSIEDRLGFPVRSNIDPTTAIAIGAAYYAGVKERKTEPKEASQTRAPIHIKAVYERATKELEEMFAARVSGEISDCFYQIRREDGGFDTGLKSLQERISEDLPLVANSFNYFTFTVFDVSHNRIETNLSSIQIGQNIYSVQGQPVTDNIYLELDDLETGSTYLTEVFKKGTLLPATSRAIRVKANRNVGSADSDDRLAVNVYQGNVEDLPEANQLIAQVLLRGAYFDEELVKGSEVELRFEISESQVISVNAYLDQLDYEHKEEFVLGTKTVCLDELQKDLANLRGRALRELEKAKESGDKEFAYELREMHQAIDELEDRSLELREDDVTDQKLEFDGRMRSLAGELHETLASRLGDRLVMKYLAWKEKCEIAIESLGDDKLVGYLEGITKNEPRFLKPPQTETLKSKIEELGSFYWSVMWKTPTYIMSRFRSLVEYEEDCNNQEAFQELIAEGQIALIDEDYDKLREISFRMYDFLPSSEREHRGKTGLSL